MLITPPPLKKNWYLEMSGDLASLWSLAAFPRKVSLHLQMFVVQSLRHVCLFATLWTAAPQASLSFIISWSLLKLMSIESVMKEKISEGVGAGVSSKWGGNVLAEKDWWSWSSNTLAIWCEQLTHWKRSWCWERLKAAGEGTAENEMVGWPH